MQSKLIYVELKTGYNDDGPAWIGRGFFSKTRRTIYFNGKVFLKGERHSAGNYLEYNNGDSYWISGVKKDGEDRHWARSGKINIDKTAVDEYLTTVALKMLPKGKFNVVELDNTSLKEEHSKIENQHYENRNP